MNNNEQFESEMDYMEMEHNIRQIREDLPGDVLASAKLVKAACDKNWDEVERLLNEGADPRICRLTHVTGEIIPALYMALKDQQFKLADKLYDAGDRLDDFIDYLENHRTCKSAIIAFLAQEMRWGRNYFYDASKPLSECCRCSAIRQIEELMPHASQEELDKSIEPTVNSWIRYFRQTELYVAILKDLARHGAKLDPEVKKELLETFDRRFGKYCPAVLHPGEKELHTMIDLIKNW